MNKLTLQKHILGLCEIKDIQVSGAELRSYTYKQLLTVYQMIKSTSSICNKTNSFYSY